MNLPRSQFSLKADLPVGFPYRLNSSFVYYSNKTYYDVVFDNNVAHVCFKVQRSEEFSYKNDPIERLLSFICGIVSVVCLCITTIVYMLPKLQNQTGRFLLCLSISLCLAQLLFFVARKAEIDSVLCKTLGIFVHFFFLASFLWMNVMSYDVFKTFSASFSNVKNNRNHFAFYSLYVWLSSLIIISVCILLDEMTSWSYRPKYGVNACWISNSKGLLAFLLIPLAVIILLNSVFFALSVRSICVTKRKSSVWSFYRPGVTAKYWFTLNCLLLWAWHGYLVMLQLGYRIRFSGFYLSFSMGYRGCSYFVPLFWIERSTMQFANTWDCRHLTKNNIWKHPTNDHCQI